VFEIIRLNVRWRTVPEVLHLLPTGAGPAIKLATRLATDPDTKWRLDKNNSKTFRFGGALTSKTPRMKLSTCLLVLALGSLAACYNPDKSKKVDPNRAQFSTTASSLLFFKNVRQLYYDRQVNEAAKLDLYRIGERKLTPTEPILNLLIVSNWRLDESYIMLEPNAFLAGSDSLRVSWRSPQTGQTGEYLFPNGDKRTHFKFAVELYGSLQDGHELALLTDSASHPVLATEAHREPFRKTMIDYLRLVGLLQ
jgi:hypothetical protein